MSHNVWKALEHLYASQSQAHLLQSKFNLQTVKKDNRTMNDYIAYVTSLTNNWVVASTPLTNKETSLYLLGGLEQEYEAIITNLTTQASSVSLANIQGMLLNYEVCINKYV
jgi:hypothetical protein